MDTRRALWTGVLVYLASFLVGAILIMLLGVDYSDPENLPASAWVASILTVITVSAGGTWWYFKDRSLRPSAREGALLGVFIILIGAVLDAVVLLIGLALQLAQMEQILAYYADSAFWLAVVLVIVTTAAVGKHLQNQRPVRRTVATLSMSSGQQDPVSAASKKTAPKKSAKRASKAPKKTAPRKKASKKKIPSRKKKAGRR